MAWLTTNMAVVFYLLSHLKAQVFTKKQKKKQKKCKSLQNLKIYTLSRGSLKLTGRLGEVMSESSSLAYSFAKRFIASTMP